MGGKNPYLHKELPDIQTPLVGKRKAAEISKKSEFDVPAPKRTKVAAVAETPLRDQMRLNLDQSHTEAWEKSSIASRYSSSTAIAGRVNIKSSLSALPAPKNSSETIADE